MFAYGVAARATDEFAVKAKDVFGVPEDELARIEGEGSLGGIGKGEGERVALQRQPYPCGVDGG